MPHQGSLLDRVIGIMERDSRAMTLGELGDLLDLDTSGRNALSCALRRAARKKVIERISLCSKCGHLMDDAKGKASVYSLARDYLVRIEEWEAERGISHRLRARRRAA